MEKNNEVINGIDTGSLDNVINLNERKQDKEFYKLYKFLFDDVYKDVCNDSKLLYTIASNALYRISKSDHKEHYKDEDGRFFVKYTRKELAEILSCSVRKVSQLKKALEDKGLIEIGSRSKMYINVPQLENDYTYIDKDTGKNKLSFYQVPKVFFHDKKYKNMSNVGKLVYSVLKARYDLSVLNTSNKGITKYIDEKGHVFCIYTNATLMAYLNVSEGIVIKAKKELVVLSLMSDKVIPNKNNKRIYVYAPSTITKDEKNPEDVSVNSMVESEEEAVQEDDNTTLNKEKVQDLKISSAEYEVGYVQNLKSRYTGFRETVKETIPNDMYDMYKEYSELNNSKDTYQTKHSNNIINFEEENKIMMLNQFPKQLKMTLKPFTIDEIKMILGIICNTKNEFNKGYCTDYDLEQFEFELVNMVKRIKCKLDKQKETVKQGVGLFKKSAFNIFKQQFDKEQEEKTVGWDMFVQANMFNNWENINHNKMQNSQKQNFGKKTDATLEELEALEIG